MPIRLRARLEGSGVGAVRHCEFTTGAFVEPITVWDAPRRLAFDVIAQPPPLQEWSPYSRVFAPHLDGFFRTSHGEFRLVALEGGRTRLEGRTWYTLDMQPAMYWSAIADTILHAIHGRVLEHVKSEAERQDSFGGPAVRGPRVQQSRAGRSQRHESRGPLLSTEPFAPDAPDS